MENFPCRIKKTQVRYQPRGDEPLAHINDHDAQRKNQALRAEGIGAAGIAAALRPYIDVPEPADHDTARYRTQQVRQNNFDDQISHKYIVTVYPGSVQLMRLWKKTDHQATGAEMDAQSRTGLGYMAGMYARVPAQYIAA